MEFEARITPATPEHGGEIIGGEELPLYEVSEEDLRLLVGSLADRAQEAAIDYQIAKDVYDRRFGAEGGV